MKRYLNKASIISFIAGIVTIWISTFAILQILKENAMTIPLWVFMFVFIGFGVSLIIYGFKIGNSQEMKNVRLTKEEKQNRKQE